MVGGWGLWLLALPVAAIAVWVAWSDMKFMRIPNTAVLALAGLWLAAGWLVVPIGGWAWGMGLALLVLVAGFVANAAGLVGAGDAKFAAAMAPFFTGADPRVVGALFAACLLGAFATHRLARALPAVRARVPDWQSWTRADFPMGLALSGTLVFYLVARLLPQG
jgi:prepilin peptidase CpaA